MGAFIVTFVATPFIARIFTPDDFGVVALFITMATLIGQLVPLAYHNAIVIPKDDAVAFALLRLSLAISFALSSGLFLVALIINSNDFLHAYVEQLSDWLLLVPLAGLMIACSSVYECWLTRKKYFLASSQATFSQAFVTSGGRISLGALYGASVWGLILPYLLGVLLRMVLLIRAGWQRTSGTRENVSLAGVSREYYEFPLFNLPAAFLRTLSDALPVLVLAHFFGASIAGLYAMADRLINMPISMGAMSVRRVYLQRAAAIKHRGGDLLHSYQRVTAYLMLLSLAPLALLMLTSEDMMRLFLGEKWGQAGAYAEILAPLLYIVLVSRPATALVDLLRKQRLWLKLQTAITLLRVFLMLAAWQLYGAVDAVLWGFVIGAGIPYIWLMIYIHRLVKVKMQHQVS